MNARRLICGVTLASLMLAFILLSMIPHTARAATGINKQLNYQARLLNSQGAVVADGTYNMEFKIYQDGTGCVSSGASPCGGTLKWTETRINTDKVTVKNGYFSVSLGSVTAFGASIDWNQDSLWLSANIGGTGSPSWDGEMLPFRQLAATPYAMNAGQLGGLDSSKFLQVAPSGVQSANLLVQAATSGSIAGVLQANAAGTGAILQLKDGAGVSVAVFGSAGATTLQNSTNSTAGFQVLTASGGGGNAVLRVDTTNERVAIGVITDPIGAKLSIATSNTVALRAYQSGANDSFQLGNATADFMTVSSTGNLLVKPTTASAAALQVQIAGTSTNVFSVDTSGLKVNIGTSDTSGTLLVLDTKTGSGDPTGTNGAMYYNSNAGVFRCFENSVWVDCISKHITALGSDVANSTTTIADATGLSFAVASGRTYRFHAHIVYNSAATTTGVKWAANGPTNSLFALAAETTNGAGAQLSCYLNVVNTLCASGSTTSLTTGNTATIDGYITTTASGTVIIRFASGVAASAITIKAGSTIEWW